MSNCSNGKGKGKLVIFSAPSGTGKGTVLKILLELCDDIVASVSWTTRSPREGEIDGVHYHFKTQEEFEQLASADGFLEFAGVFDNRYGTPKDFVEDNIALGKSVVLEIDIQGALQVMEKCGDYVSIFLLPPGMNELRRRLEDRGTETPEKIEKRLATAYRELGAAENYQYCIINDDINAAVDAMSDVLDGKNPENHLTAEYIDFIKTLQEERT